MATFLVLGDLHGALGALRAIREQVAALGSDCRPDAILATGDFVTAYKLPPSHADAVARRLVAALERELGRFGCEVLCVAGNHDRPDLWGVAGCLRPIDAYAGAPERSIAGFRVLGFGGSWQLGMFPYEWEDGVHLTERLRELIPKCDGVPEVLLTHAPPAGAGVGTLLSGEETGSVTIRALIAERQPVLNVCGHVHEAAGWGLLGRTWVLNAGAVSGLVRLGGSSHDSSGPLDLVDSEASFRLVRLTPADGLILALEGHLLGGRWRLRRWRAAAGHIAETGWT